MNFYRKYTTKPYSFLVLDTTLTLDNPLHFRKIFRKSIKTNHDNWWIVGYDWSWKLQYDTNREAAKISTLSSGKIDKYE